MKVAKIVFIILITNVLSFSQLKSKKMIYVELLGKSLAYSINIEKYVFEKNSLNIGLRVGASFFGISNHLSFFSIPYGVQFLFGEKKGHFEISYGHTLFLINHYSKNQNGIVSLAQNLSFGYKFIPLSRKGICFSPFVSVFIPMFYKNRQLEDFSIVNNYSTTVTPFIGFQIGYLF